MNRTKEINLNAKIYTEECGRKYIYLDSPKTNKEKVALKQLKKHPIKEGLICAIGTVENCTALVYHELLRYLVMDITGVWINVSMQLI